MRYQVWDLDVWGNEEDGFTINDRSRREILEVDGRGDKAIKDAVVRSGMVKRTATAADLDIDDPTCEGSFWINDAKTGEPLYEFEPLNED